MNEERVRNRNALLNVLSAINSKSSLPEVLQMSCQAVVDLFGVAHSGLVRFDLERNRGEVVAEYPAWGLRDQIIPVAGIEVEERLLQSARPYQTDQVAAENNLGEIQQFLLSHDIQSILIIPIIQSEKVIGSFSLDVRERGYQFSDDEIQLSQLFAAQIATAINKAELLAEANKRVHQLKTLRRTTLALTSELSRNDLLQEIIQQAVAILGARSGGIKKYYPERDCLEIVADYGHPVSLEGHTIMVGEGMAGRLIETGESSLLVNNYQKWSKRIDEVGDQGEFGSIVCVTLRQQARTIGVLYVEDVPERSFQEDEVEQLQMFADHAAIAFINAELADEKAKRLQRLQELTQARNEIMQELGTMPLSERLHMIAERAAKILRAEGCGISLVQRPGVLAVVADYGYKPWPNQTGQEFVIQSKPGGGLTGHIAYTGELFNEYGRNLRNHFAVHSEAIAQTDSGQCNSLLVIPLQQESGDSKKLLGLLRIENKLDANRKPTLDVGFSQADEYILRLFAADVVVAIESAGLVQELNVQKEEIKQQKEAYARLVTGSPTGIIANDKDGRITIFNGKAEQILGYGRDEICDQPVTQIYAEPNEAALIGQAIREQGVITAYDTLLLSKSGQRIPIRLTAMQSTNGHHEPDGYVGYFEDLREIRETSRRLDLILQAGKLLAQAAQLQDGLEQLAELMVVHFDASFCRVFLLNEEADLLQMTAVYPQTPEIEAGSWQPVLGSVTAVADWPKLDELLSEWSSNIIRADGRTGQKILQQWTTLLQLDAPIQSLLVVPLRARDNKVVGLLDLGHLSSATFAPAQQQLIEAVAQQTAVLIDRFRLYETTKLTEERLRASYAASNALVARQAPRQLLQEMVTHIQRVTGAYGVRMFQAEPQSGEIVDYVYIGPETIVAKGKIRADGLTMQVIVSGSPVFVPDVAHEPQANPTLAGRGIQALMGWPVAIESATIGVIWIYFDAPRQFSSSEKEAVQLFVNQAAVAYDNARRIHVLEMMQQTAEALAAAGDVTAVSEQIVKSACEVLHADYALFWAYDDARDRFILQDSRAAGIDDQTWQIFKQAEPNIGGRVATVMARGWVGVSDIAHFHQEDILGQRTRKRLQQIGIQSFQGISLQVGNEKLGVLYLNYEQSRTFNEEEQANVRTFANHAAFALKNIKLLEHVSKVKDTAKIVARMATLDQREENLHQVVQKMREALGCDLMTLHIYDPERARFTLLPITDGIKFLEHEWTKVSYGRSRTVLDAVLEAEGNREKLIIADDISLSPVFKNSPFTKTEKVRSTVAVLLTIGDDVVGILFVSYRTLHRFTGGELEHIRFFADQAAVAIHNLHLYEKRLRYFSVIETLENAVKEISSSLDEYEILNRLVHYVWNMMTYEKRVINYASAWLVHESIGQAEVVASAPYEKLEETHQSLGGNLDYVNGVNGRIGLIGRVIQTGKPILENDVTQNLDYIGSHPETHSELVVPISLPDGRQNVMGVLNVQHPDFDAFDPEDLRDLQVLASQAAVAMEKARLYKTLKKGAETLQALGAAAHAVTSPLDWKETLFAIAEVACKLPVTSGKESRFSHLALLQGRMLSFEAAYPREHLAVIHAKNRKIDLKKAKRIGITGTAVLQGEPILVPDVTKDDRYISSAPQIRSEFAIPIKKDGRVIGVINVEHEQLDAFDDQDIMALTTLAEYASIAIHNAQLYDWLETVYRISREAASSLDMPQLLQTVCRRLEQDAWVPSIASIRLYDEKQEILINDPAWHESLHEKIDIETEKDWTKQSLDEGICGWVATHKQPINVGDVTDPTFRPSSLRLISSTRSEICVPILYGADKRLLGVLHMQSGELNAYDENNQRFLSTLADQLAVTIHKVKELEDVNVQVEAHMALAWMGMASNTWWHSMRSDMLAVDNYVVLAKKYLQATPPLPLDEMITAVTEPLTRIQNLAKKILERPITPPLGSEEGVEQLILNDFVHERVNQLWKHAPYKKLEPPHVELSETIGLTTKVSREWLRRAFDLVLENAVRATIENEQTALHIFTNYDKEAISIYVKDSGLGIPDDVLELLFKKPIKNSKGLGMGLLIVQAIMQAFRGEVAVLDTGGEGTTIVLSLPLATQP